MSEAPSVYPEHGRTAWILARRPPRTATPDPYAAHGVFLERERLASGDVVDSGVALLTNRECPWRCLMCDLWKDTLRESVPAGATAAQVEAAVQRWTEAGVHPAQVKLYNSGSFFDPSAIPPGDYAAIARHVAFARHIVVESHPLLIGDRTWAWRDMLAGSLEVAMGLETAHPQILEKLNKKFTLQQFGRAAEQLARERVGMRAFILVNAPFLDATSGLEWTHRSVEFAFSCGASAVSLIPTRIGNGAMDELLAAGELVLPTLATLEEAQSRALALRSGRVFVDTWGLEPFSSCPQCFAARRQRLETINLTQCDAPRFACAACSSPN